MHNSMFVVLLLNYWTVGAFIAAVGQKLRRSPEPDHNTEALSDSFLANVQGPSEMDAWPSSSNYHQFQVDPLAHYDPVRDTFNSATDRTLIGHDLDVSDHDIDMAGRSHISDSSLNAGECHSEEDVNSEKIFFYKKCHCLATEVDCAGQNLTSLPSGISPLTTRLDLSMNSLERVPEDTFEKMTSLRSLRCVGNNLTKLPKRLFQFNNYLQSLNFQGNAFRKVPVGPFQNLHYLIELHLDANEISGIHARAFAGLTSLKQLWLDDNRLDQVPTNALRELVGLQALALSMNQITEVPDLAFQNNTNLIQLRLCQNRIREVGDQAFYGLSKLKFLQMNHNQLSTMPSALSYLTSLEELDIENNLITHIPEKSFLLKENLTTLKLRNNPISSVGEAAFSHLPSLQDLKLSDVHDMTNFPDLTGTNNLLTLHVDRAHIRVLPYQLCSNLKKLKILDVHSNKIGTLSEMSQCKQLTTLNMGNNELTSLEGGIFDGMDNLKDLTLSNNYIYAISADAFIGLRVLEYLNLAENQIGHINLDAFLPLRSLKDLNLGTNRLQRLPTAGLTNLERLKVFRNPDMKEFPPKEAFPNVNSFVLSYAYHCCDFINSRPQQVYLDVFRERMVWMDAGQAGQMTLWERYYNDSRQWERIFENTSIEDEMWESFTNNDYNVQHKLVEPYLEESKGHTYSSFVIAKAAISCKPKPGPFMPCDDLFGWWSLRCGVWFVFMLALVGNGVVFFVSVTSKSKMDVPRFFICNLAVADFFMGVYLGILAIMDASTLGQFKKFAIQWQMSAGCLLAGTLGVLSSELSVFTLTVITLERFYAITHAMQLNKRLSLKHAGLIMLCGWICSFGLAILPLFGISDYRKFAVCLPFEIEDIVSKSYVCFIMVFNGISFFIILTCYMVMYISIRDSQAWNSNDTRVAKRMALLVFTDFLCWAPIAILSLAAAFGQNLIHLNEAKVLTIFILPLNSCANPFLYAFFTKQFKRDCVLLCRRLEDSSLARHFSQVSQRHVSLSWKLQRRPSALYSLMGEVKCHHSNNVSTGSHSYGLINYNSEMSSETKKDKPVYHKTETQPGVDVTLHQDLKKDQDSIPMKMPYDKRNQSSPDISVHPEDVWRLGLEDVMSGGLGRRRKASWQETRPAVASNCHFHDSSANLTCNLKTAIVGDQSHTHNCGQKIPDASGYRVRSAPVSPLPKSNLNHSTDTLSQKSRQHCQRCDRKPFSLLQRKAAGQLLRKSSSLGELSSLTPGQDANTCLHHLLPVEGQDIGELVESRDHSYVADMRIESCDWDEAGPEEKVSLLDKKRDCVICQNTVTLDQSGSLSD